MNRLVVITGSRALADTDEAAAFARVRLNEWIGSMGAGDFILTGGCPTGPDAWSRDFARAAKHVDFNTDGWRYVRDADGQWRREWQWSPTPVHPLARNVAMVEAAARAKQRGLDVVVFGLVAPWSRTHGTEHTLTHAERMGLRVARKDCPLERGPKGKAA